MKITKDEIGYSVGVAYKMHKQLEGQGIRQNDFWRAVADDAKQLLRTQAEILKELQQEAYAKNQNQQ